MIKARGNKVVLEITERKDSEGSIIIPETYKGKKSNFAEVISVGDSVNLDISVGDTVVYEEYSGIEYGDYLIVDSEDIILVIED